MKLIKWTVVLEKEWDKNFKKFDIPVQKRIWKKLRQLEQPLQARGLKRNKFLVEEVGQYRIAFYQNAKTKSREIHFIGTHKQYEKWYKKE